MPPLASAAALRIIDAMAIVMSQALQLARSRIASAASPVMRMMAERDHAAGELELLRRELDILRSQRRAMAAHRRPDYTPTQRLAIIQLMRLRSWSVAIVAKRFVLHPNTVRAWVRAVEGRGNDRLLSPAIVWNRLDDLVRCAAHELRRLCPEPEFGSRTIARHLVRAGIRISRITVQRALREPKPRPRPHRPKPMAVGVKPHHLLVPSQSNDVWHMDLAVLRVLWMRFTIAAVLDGFTRRLLALRVYSRAPHTDDVASLIRSLVREYGTPRFLITDHGTQFRRRFKAAMAKMDIHHVRGRVRQPFLNGKIERLFRSFRLWWRFVLPVLTVGGIQTKLDNFRQWYNQHRVHAALGAMTPNEAAGRIRRPEPVVIRQQDHCQVAIRITRRHCRGDTRLPIVDITLKLPRAA